MTSSRWRWLLVPSAFLLVTLLYIPSIGGGFFFDDAINIVDEETLRVPDLSARNLLEAAFPLELGGDIRPLSRLSFALNWYVSGMNPGAFRMVNLALHGLNAVLVLIFVEALLVRYRGNRPDSRLPSPWLAAAIAALLWAAAPIHANTVPYIVQRMTLLAATFTLIALIGYLQLRLAVVSRRRSAALGWGALAGVAALLGFMSKETAALLPVYVLVMEATLLHPVRAGPDRAGRNTAWLAPTALLLPLMALATLAVMNQGWTPVYDMRGFGLLERLMTESRVVGMYLANVLLPQLGQIHFYYDNFPVSHGLLSPPTTLASLTLIAGLIALALLGRLRWPLLAFAILWFLGGHLLEGTLVPLELVFWHRNYLPSLGPLVLVAWCLTWLLAQPGANRRIGALLALLLGLLFAGQTLILAYTWGSPLQMAFAEYQANPTSPRANYQYARQSFAVFETTKDRLYLDRSADYFARTVELDPQNLLALYGMLKLQISYGHDYGTADPYRQLLETLRSAPPRIANTAPMNYIAALAREHPDKLDAFDVLALYDAIAENPLTPRGTKTAALIAQAYFLNANGFPLSQALDLLREARCRDPGNFFARIKLLEGLVASGNLEEAEPLLRTGFTPWEKALSTSWAYAAQILRDRYRTEP